MRPSNELCIRTCAPDGAVYVCDEAADQTYENACYANCYGIPATVPGPCLPPGLKGSRRAANYAQSLLKGVPAAALLPAPDPPASNTTANTTTRAGAAALAGDDAAALAAAADGAPAAAASPWGFVADSGALVVPPSTRQPLPRIDRAALRASLLAVNATGAAGAAAVTPKQGGTQLYVRRNCNEEADLWFVAYWVPVGRNAWANSGWLRIPRSSRDYVFGTTTYRYIYLYAFARQCASGRCCNPLYWGGSTSINFNGANYGFQMYDMGTKPGSYYGMPLSCSCNGNVNCLQAPCCTCR